MKKIKSMIAMIMAIVMIMGMSTMAFAAEPDEADIIIHKASDASITYLQVIEPSDETVTGWAFVNDTIKSVYVAALGCSDVTDESQEPDKLITADQVAIAKLIKYEKDSAFTQEELGEMSPSLKYLLSNVDKATASEIDKALAGLDSNSFTAGFEKKCITNGCSCAHVENGAVCDLCKDGNCACEFDWILTVNEAGIYAVRGAESGYTYKVMAAYIGFGAVTEDQDTEDPSDDVTYAYPALVDKAIIAKKAPTSVEKETTDEDLAVGINDIVTYVVELYVPFIDPVIYPIDRTFTVKDVITGAEYYLEGTDAVATVKMDDVLLDTVAIEEDDSTTDEDFIVNLDSLVQDLDNPNAGNKITITYTAKVTGLTVVNNVTAHENSNSYGGDSVTVYTGKILFTKFNEDETVKLSNAGFTVTKGTETLLFTKVKDGLYTYDPINGTAEIFTAENDYTDDQGVARLAGTVTIQGLDLGTYTFTETSAPEGYSINEVPVNVELTDADEGFTDGVAGSIFADDNEANKMLDTKLLALPSTGGIGTTIFTVAGCVIMIAAAALFFANRRKENR